ncbi:MAG TPA: PDZ domain-containing protein [Gemmatimonadota bacterium]|nr:PDZ domain-containing protein [Gemmatimonadota bacterium]
MPGPTSTFATPALAALLAASALSAQEPPMPSPVRYFLGWDNPASQLYTVRVTAPAQEGPVVFSLPAWRPGRYIVQNYAANVQAVRAEDEDGDPLPVEWVDLDSWRVEPGDAQTVTLAYEWYAATLDAGSSFLRPGLAYFNPVNLLPWVEGRMDHPVTLELQVPDTWPIATQLTPTDEHGVFTAADYHALADAPTIASPEIVQWDFSHDDVPYYVVFRPLPDLGEHDREGILADIEAIAREQTAMFGGAPYEEYWFLYQFVPRPFGHAVEHASSSSYVLGPVDRAFSSRPSYLGFLGITAHELFHAWNVKRLRPAALWPYDYSEPQLTRLHWVTEGVTSYYDNLTLARAGLMSEEEYWKALEQNVQSLQGSPGRRVTSAALASLTSWHSGYGSGNPNQSISFYTKGALLGLLLDLQIRDATDGARSLDDVMRALYARYYERGEGMPEDAFQTAVAEVAGRSFGEFFERYVHGTDELPYGPPLSVVGLEAREVPDPDRPEATLGIATRRQGEETVIVNVLPDGPGLTAGLMRDDVVLELDGSPVEGDLRTELAEVEPGSAVRLKIRRGTEEMDIEVRAAGGGNMAWRVTTVENPDERQLRLRAGWLASSSGRD